MIAGLAGMIAGWPRRCAILVAVCVVATLASRAPAIAEPATPVGPGAYRLGDPQQALRDGRFYEGGHADTSGSGEMKASTSGNAIWRRPSSATSMPGRT